MLFNSCEFLLFLGVVLLLTFLVPHKYRWLILLIASCGFYMAFVPVYILILFATIVIDYWAGIRIEDSTNKLARSAYLIASIVSVCGILFYFKYFNFLAAAVQAFAGMLGLNYSARLLEIILPIGLSFHTFQSLSYVIEVYKGRQTAERHFGYYSLYVMYFPQLVAGPIERPQNLLKQFKTPTSFDWQRFYEGLCLCLLGFFKKVVVSDTLGGCVDLVYDQPDRRSGLDFALATYFFSLQIYGDFSGYSDIARGVSRMFGIELMVNFRAPYFSSSVSEFWSRWHISLSTWFRDYVYIPMGGNRVSAVRCYFNVMTVFVLSGIWHGANWTFVVWGVLHGLYVVLERVLGGRKPVEPGDRSGWVRNMAAGLLTYHLVLITWVFFRAHSVGEAFIILNTVATDLGALTCGLTGQHLLVIALFLGMEILDYLYPKWKTAEEGDSLLKMWCPLALLFTILLLGVERGAQFIYFQF